MVNFEVDALLSKQRFVLQMTDSAGRLRWRRGYTLK